MLKKIFVVLMVVLGATSVLSAQNLTVSKTGTISGKVGTPFNGYVIITNSTGYTFNYIYVSHADETNWGDDVLGSSILSNGESIRVNLSNYPSSIFDIKCTDADGDTYTFRKFNVATDDLTVTLSNLDSSGGAQ